MFHPFSNQILIIFRIFIKFNDIIGIFLEYHDCFEEEGEEEEGLMIINEGLYKILSFNFIIRSQV